MKRRGANLRVWMRRNCWVLLGMLLFLNITIPAVAREAKPDTYAGFEGRTVSQVEISIRPTMNPDAFRPLLKLKPGEPFSSAAVQQTVTALQETKQFAKVQVSVEPQQDGLSVLFILEPASYVGIISFPGAPRSLVYTPVASGEHTGAVSLFRRPAAAGTKGSANFFANAGIFLGESRTRNSAGRSAQDCQPGV